MRPFKGTLNPAMKTESTARQGGGCVCGVVVVKMYPQNAANRNASLWKQNDLKRCYLHPSSTTRPDEL